MNTQPRTKSQRQKAGLFSLIALIIMVTLLIVEPQFFWVPLPFTLTYLVIALDVI